MNRRIEQPVQFATRMALLFVMLAPLVACADDSTSFVGEAHVIVGFSPTQGSSFSARLNGRTYTSAGGFPVNLSSLGSVYEITGTFTGNGLGVFFAASTAAGVESGSVTSLQGPGPQLTGCGITYVSTTPGPQPFRLQFKITGTAGLVCS